MADPALSVDGLTQEVLSQSRRAVSVAFIGAGFAFSSWAAEIPRVRDHLHINPGQLGLLLLAIAIGSVIALPLAGMIVHRLGEARTVAITSLLMAAGLAVVGVGYRYNITSVAVGLFGLGFGLGSWEVAMNVQGAAVERQLGRPIMSKFHAGYSIGTVAGAGLGALIIATGVPVTAHLLAVAVVIAVAMPASTRKFLSSEHLGHPITGQTGSVKHSQWAAWKEPRTLLIGLFVLCMAFTEGTGNDWLSTAMIDGYHERAALGTLTFSVFLAAMTTGRWFGPTVLNRYGRVIALRSSAVVAAAGLLLVVFGSAVPVAMIGAALWGLGAALGFPTGMSAASDDPRHAAARVSVTASIGYLAFLGGPPLIGQLGDHVGVLRSLLLAAGLLGIGILVAGATAPEAGARSTV